MSNAIEFDHGFENNFKNYIGELQFSQMIDNENRWRAGERPPVKTQEEADRAVAMKLAARYLPGRDVPEDIAQYLP